MIVIIIIIIIIIIVIITDLIFHLKSWSSCSLHLFHHTSIITIIIGSIMIISIMIIERIFIWCVARLYYVILCCIVLMTICSVCRDEVSRFTCQLQYVIAFLFFALRREHVCSKGLSDGVLEGMSKSWCSVMALMDSKVVRLVFFGVADTVVVVTLLLTPSTTAGCSVV